MPFKPFRFTGFKKGLYAPANLFDQPPGTLPRIVNLLFTERGGLVTVDGSHIISKPAPAAPLLAFVSSGAISGAAPPAPTAIAGSVELASPGFTSPGFTITLPMPTVNAGDVVIAILRNSLYTPPVGGNAALGVPPPGWTTFIGIPSFPAGSALFSWVVAYRVIDGTEGSSVSFFFPSNIGPGGFDANVATAAIIPIRGASSVAPIDNVQFDVSGSNSGGSFTTPHRVLTHFTNDLILMYFHGEGVLVTPNPPAGAHQDLLFQKDIGANISGEIITVDLAADQAFVGPGTSPTYTSTGWGANQGIQDFLIAMGAGFPITGQLEGFVPSSNGPITPTPIIVGSSTLLTAPQGCMFDAKHQLWVADFESATNGGIFMYKTPQVDKGNVAPDAAIEGTLTLLRNPYDVFVDLNEVIYVANFSGPNILIFPSGSSGNVGPSLSISGSNTTLVHPIGVAVDSVGNVYVLDQGVNAIKIWNAGVTGNVAPSRTITGVLTRLQNPLAIRIDPSGMLWVTCGKSGANPAFLLGFAVTSSTNGNIPPSAEIDSTGLQPASGDGGPTGIAFDKAGNIYVAILSQHLIQEFNAADRGTVSPDQTISGFTNGPFGVAVIQN